MNFLEPIEYVVKNSQYVRINLPRLEEFSRHLPEEVPSWQSIIPTKPPKRFTETEKTMFLLVFNSLNFCFWGEPKWKITYQEKELGGSWGLMSALYRAIEEGNNIMNPHFLKAMTEEKAKEIFKGNVEIPLLKKRKEILQEIGTSLVENFDADPKKVFDGCVDVVGMIKKIVKYFPCFEDKSIYKGKEIYFYKRAQLLGVDIIKEVKKDCKGINKLIAFADYKIPWVLRKHKVLEYNTSLSEKIDNHILILEESEEEIEIRANTVWAIELLRRMRKKTKNPMNSVDIDMLLWLQGKKKDKHDPPHHRTYTTKY